MNFISVQFLIYFLVFFVFYYVFPKQYRYFVLFLAGMIFYGYGNPPMLIVLVIVAIWTYIGGLVLSVYPKRVLYMVFFIVNMAFIAIYKGTDLVAPLGISFYVFQSSTYLSDVYRGRMLATKNFILYFAFLSFFPTVISGPIQQARELLPQIKEGKDFEYDLSSKGALLFLYGCFEKLLVANKLALIIENIYVDIDNTKSIECLVAVCLYSIYIYADFSAYSDMACGIAAMLGIRIRSNFNRPYLSTSIASFWQNWHMSLMAWLKDNIYIPLGGSRKGTFRKYLNVLIVFGFSGLWHGFALHYFFWGICNGIFQIAGQVIMPFKHKIYRICRVNENCFAVRTIKRVGVFILISFTWIFFRLGIHDSIKILGKMAQLRPVDFFDIELMDMAGNSALTLLLILTTVTFIKIQCLRQNEKKYYIKYMSQPLFFRLVLLSVIMAVIVCGSCIGRANVNTDFIYFQF